jgi:hypothetical protein
MDGWGLGAICREVLLVAVAGGGGGGGADKALMRCGVGGEGMVGCFPDAEDDGVLPCWEPGRDGFPGLLTHVAFALARLNSSADGCWLAAAVDLRSSRPPEETWGIIELF